MEASYSVRESRTRCIYCANTRYFYRLLVDPIMEQMELMESAESVAHECEHCGARLLACDFDHTTTTRSRTPSITT